MQQDDAAQSTTPLAAMRTRPALQGLHRRAHILLLFTGGMLWAATTQAEPPSQPPAAPPPPVSTAAPSAAPLPRYMLDLDRGEQLLRRGDYLGAAHALATARAGVEGAPSAPPGVLAKIRGLQSIARSLIGALRIFTLEGGSIEVDGHPFGPAPIAGEVLVAPGKHRIVVRGRQCLGTKNIGVRAGEAAAVHVPCTVGPAWRQPLLVSSLVVGALALGAGVVWLTVSEEKAAAIDTRVQSARIAGWVDYWVFDEMKALDRERVGSLNASITAFLIAGGSAFASGVLMFGVAPQRQEEPARTWGVNVGPGSAGLWMRW
jgi:hypothetical protein